MKVKSFTRISVVHNLTNEGLLGELLVNLVTSISDGLPTVELFQTAGPP